jgi:Copper type II ascorbate-dependent monooxygenase, N-terminal domain
LLDTADAQDHAVINDSETSVPAERIIAAWGDSDTVEYHGLINRARGTIRWFGVGDEYVKFHKQVDAEADGYFDLRVNNFSIAAIETNYVDFCFNWDIDIVPQGLPSNRNVAIMAAEILIDKESAPFVHHAAVSASPNTGNASRTCLASKEYTQFLYSWTPGTLPFLLPPDIGITLGSGELQGLQSFRLQIHYNNPKFIESMRDNGGLRVYYTLARPLYEAGLLPLGDLLTSLEGTPINVGTSRFDFSCDGACSSLVLDNEPVTVIHEFFHMHNRGAAAVQYQIRDGAVVRQANVNFFDFDQAGTKT